MRACRVTGSDWLHEFDPSSNSANAHGLHALSNFSQLPAHRYQSATSLHVIKHACRLLSHQHRLPPPKAPCMLACVLRPG
jgi:hypothetical protein